MGHKTLQEECFHTALCPIPKTREPEITNFNPGLKQPLCIFLPPIVSCSELKAKLQLFRQQILTYPKLNQQNGN